MVVKHPDRGNQDCFGHLGQHLHIQFEALEEVLDSFADRATRAPPQTNYLEIALAILLVSMT